MGEISVKVTPKSSREEIAFKEGIARVWVRAAPSDGEANEAVCRLVAKRLGVPPSAVRVARGQTSRTKVIECQGLDSPEIEARLKR